MTESLEKQRGFLYNAPMTALTKRRIITIAGRPGSGKSTTSRAIAAELGYEHFSSGDLFRAISKERGLELQQSNLLAEQEKEIDLMVDKRLREIGASQEQVVIDSRMAWHWMPLSFKVYLNLDLEVAARRIIQNTDPVRLAHEHIPSDPKQYALVLQARLESETRRYKNLYDANPYEVDNYDLIVDTNGNTLEQIAAQVINAYHAWLGKA